MDENRYNNYEDEMEIDLIDMMFYLLKKWRGLLLAVLIGVIVGAGLYVVKNRQQQAEQAQKASELVQADEDEEFDESDYKISKDSRAAMEIAYQYRQLYNKQQEYNSKSIIMQLDPNAVYTGELKYYISAGNNTGFIGVLYQNVISDEDILEELKDASGLDCDTQYIKELIDSVIADESGTSININSGDGMDSVNAVVKNSFVTYKVISTSQDSCEQMLQVIREKVDQLNAEAIEQYGSYSVVEVGDHVGLVTDNTYLTKQKTNVDQLNTYSTAVKNAEKDFSDEEKTYYNKKYLAKEYAEKADTEEGKDLLLEEVEAAPVSKVKWLVIGVILLVMFWGAYYVVKYILDKKVKTVSELQSTYRLQVIGRVAAGERTSKGLDKFIDKIYEGIKEQPDTLDYVVQAVNAMEGGKAVLCGNAEVLEVKNVMDQLTSECGGLEKGEFCSRSAASLEKAKAAGKEILVVCIGKTRRGEIEREMESCRLQKIRVAGVVVVE